MNRDLYCNRCLLSGEPRLEYRHHSTGKHLGAWCRSCDSWIQWVPQNGEWVALYDKQQNASRNHPMHPETWTPEYAEKRRADRPFLPPPPPESDTGVGIKEGGWGL